MSAYPYPGVPLSPNVFAEVAPTVVPINQTLSRPEIIDLVVEAHRQGGGRVSDTSIISAAKKALRALAAEGIARNVAYGYWRFGEALTPDEIQEPVNMGDGKEAVYVYYFPAYRDQAAHLGRSDWPMKIGMTTGEVRLRIKEQSSTAMPEEPTVGLIYRTNAAANDERLLHSTLRARGRHLSGAPGREWYMTSLVEIREILDFATNGRHDVSPAHS